MRDSAKIVRFPVRRATKDVRDEKLVARRVQLPRYIWDRLEADAERCRRTRAQHLELILACMFGYETIEGVSLRSDWPKKPTT